MLGQPLRFALAAFVCVTSVAQAQEQLRPKLDIAIGEIRHVSLFRVPVTMRNTSNDDVFVPVCGESEGGTKKLCTLGVNIDTRSHGHWVAAKEKSCNCNLLGGASLKTGITLPAGETMEFEYFLPSEFFRFRSGQYLRLRIFVWPNAAAVNDKRTRMELTTPEFQFP